jgi:simple sugar transport system permease protein
MEGALDLVVPILAATLRVATPLLLAALAGLFAERSGVVDVGLEGKMLAGAFAAAATAAVTGSAWLGLGAAILAASALALLHAFACVTLRGSQVVSGMAINVLASGLTATLALAWFRQGGQTPALPASARFPAIPLAGAEWIAEVPVLGRVLTGIVGGHTAPVYIAFALVPVAAFVLWRTRFGLRLRACGEAPGAVDAAGVSVARLRYAGVMIAGVLCGMAGAAISTAQGAAFATDMTAGRGFIALAALILANWKPWPVLATCLLFGLLDAVAIRLQGVPVPGLGVAFPVQAVQALPYVLTVILLAGFVGRAVAPRAAGIPYVKER